jgi:ferric-dicitrate binding protein FerR (iron transport regulator)
MTHGSKPGSFEDFLRWLGTTKDDSEPDPPAPDSQVLSAAREAWQEHQSLQHAQREALSERVPAGTYVTTDDKPVQSFWSRVFAAVSDALVPRWQTAAITVAALGVASVGLLLWNLMPITRVSAPAETAALHFETRHGEQQTHRLADGSVLHLNTDSSVSVLFTQAERLLTLASGEADFEVAHAPERPFRVVAGPVQAIARGTQFDVRLRDDSAVVTVVKGHVAVAPAPVADGLRGGRQRLQPARFIELGPNQQITVPRGEWPVIPVAVDAERSTSWLHRQIAFKHEPLERVVAEFNRYASKPIEITTPELRNLEISGVFATDDPAAFIAFLRSEGVRVDETATRIRASKK